MIDPAEKNTHSHMPIVTQFQGTPYRPTSNILKFQKSLSFH